MSAEARFDDGQGKMATGALRIALAGNPNCGKTTVFNAYTGARQHVGNYPGVTVDRKEGHVRHGNADITLVDLPGTYSLTAYSMEELVARAELGSGDVQAVINVVDASALERNLLLTVQMMEMGLPVVLVCNMMDEARKAGVHIDMDRLSKMMGIPVVSAVARTGEGLQQALGEAVRLAGEGRRRVLELNYGADIDEGLRAMCAIINREGLLKKYAAHWIAVKLMEGDAEIRKEVHQANSEAAEELDVVRRKVAEHIRTGHNISMEAYITDARYGYIRGLLRDGVVRQDAGKDRLALSDKLDKVLTNAFFGPLIMLAVLYGLFYVTIEVGAYPQGWVEDACAALGEFFAGIIPEGELQSLVVDGIIGGVGGGNLSGQTPQKRIPCIPGRRFQSLFAGDDPAGAQMQRNIVAPAEIRHKGLVPVGFGTAQMVIEVSSFQGNTQLIPQQIQRKQHCHGIRAAGDRRNYAVSGGKKRLLFQKGAQFIQHASTPGPRRTDTGQPTGALPCRFPRDGSLQRCIPPCRFPRCLDYNTHPDTGT